MLVVGGSFMRCISSEFKLEGTAVCTVGSGYSSDIVVNLSYTVYARATCIKPEL